MLVDIYPEPLGRKPIYHNIVSLRNRLQEYAESVLVGQSQFEQCELETLSILNQIDHESCLTAVEAISRRASTVKSRMPRPPAVFATFFASPKRFDKEIGKLLDDLGVSAKHIGDLKPVAVGQRNREDMIETTARTLKARGAVFADLQQLRGKLDSLSDELSRTQLLHSRADQRFAWFLGGAAIGLLVIAISVFLFYLLPGTGRN